MKSATTRTITALWMLGAFMALPAVTPAVAAPACRGVYSATALHPLPTPLSVRTDVRDQSPSNIRLADRFVAGMRDAGVGVGEPANAVLHVTTSLMGGASSSSGGTGEQSYREFGGLDGGVNFGMPSIPDRSARRGASPPVLFLRVEVNDVRSTRPSWVGSLQCTLTGGDQDQLAQEIGRLVGETLGKRVDRRRL